MLKRCLLFKQDVNIFIKSNVRTSVCRFFYRVYCVYSWPLKLNKPASFVTLNTLNQTCNNIRRLDTRKTISMRSLKLRVFLSFNFHRLN